MKTDSNTGVVDGGAELSEQAKEAIKEFESVYFEMRRAGFSHEEILELHKWYEEGKTLKHEKPRTAHEAVAEALAPYGPNPTPADYAAIIPRFADNPEEYLYLLICLGMECGAITPEMFKSFEGRPLAEVEAEVRALAIES
jgi:hypothetical protein